MTMTNSSDITTAIIADPRWQQLNDASANGHFIYAVITTGIYCRPGCPSPPPNPDNVRFFDNPVQAEAAGFRACKRCRPQDASSDSQQTERITRLCRYIETAQQEPTLAELANYAGISAYHLQRLFKSSTGLSPKAYAKAYRQQQDNQQVSRHKRNTAMTIQFAIGESSLGKVLIAQNEKGICAILLDDETDALLVDLQRRFPKAVLVKGDTTFEKNLRTVIRLIEQPETLFDLPMDIRGTVFQQQVWDALQKIPPGETRSYSDIANAIGSPNAVRAVAGACAANNLAIAIPCHRVVRSDGNLSGYRWGVARKKILLARESLVKKT